MPDAEDTMEQDDDVEWSSIAPPILAHLRAIALTFVRGVPGEQAHRLVEELRGLSDAVRVEPSDRPEVAGHPTLGGPTARSLPPRARGPAARARSGAPSR